MFLTDSLLLLNQIFSAKITINGTINYMGRGVMIFRRGIDITRGIGWPVLGSSYTPFKLPALWIQPPQIQVLRTGANKLHPPLIVILALGIFTLQKQHRIGLDYVQCIYIWFCMVKNGEQEPYNSITSIIKLNT